MLALWGIILLLKIAKDKAKLIELLFDDFDGLVHVLQSILNVYISGGFEDWMKTLTLSRGGSFTDFEQRLSCTHKGVDTRAVLHRLGCLKKGNEILCVDANDIGIVALLLYHYRLFLGYHSNREKQRFFNVNS